MGTASMTPVDYTGADGGRLALAFAAGAAAAWAFIKTFVSKPIERALGKRITDLEASIVDERAICRAMETRLVDRIQQLETLLLTHSVGDLRQAMQRVVSEQRLGKEVE